jgi:surfeit locus 1 family protein
VTASARRFPFGLTIATLIGFAILCGLGAWQVQRLHWKEGLLARIAALRAASAQPVDAALDRLARGGDLDFTRVAADCPGLGAAPFLELYAIRDGQAGSRLISACAVASQRYRTVLVDRGFVADVISARPPVDRADRTPLRVVGVLRAPDRPNAFTPPNETKANHWYSRDVPAMARALGAPSPAPLMLLAETSTNPGWQALVPAPLPTEIPNRHLEYAITWFGLAGALLAVYAAMLWRMWKS